MRFVRGPSLEVAEALQEAGNGQRHTDIKLYYENGDSWKQMLEEVRPDAVFICTPWRLHAPMAIEAMKQEAHAFVEVPLGLTNEESGTLWIHPKLQAGTV